MIKGLAPSCILNTILPKTLTVALIHGLKSLTALAVMVRSMNSVGAAHEIEGSLKTELLTDSK